MDWIFALGIAFIVAFFAVIIFYFVKGIKGGFLNTLIDFGSTAVSLIISFFSAKFVLKLFDKIYAFSMSYFDKFATAFSKIPLMNELIDSTTFATQITKFKNTDVVMSSWMKGFLIKIFENTRLYEGEVTNLSTIAANAMSYILVLMVVILTMFTVLKVVADKLVKKHVKITPTKNAWSKIGGFFFGTLTGLIYVVLFIAVISVAPIGADNTIFADSINKTVVLKKPFEYAQAITIDYFANNIDWTAQNQNFTNISDILLTTYVNKADDDNLYHVEVEVLFGNQMTERIYNRENLLISSETYKYVYANGSLWVYGTRTEESNYNKDMFIASRKLSKKRKTLVYKTEFEVDGEVIKYNKVLVQQG